MLSLCVPLLINAIIRYIQDPARELQQGIMLVAGVFVVKFVNTMCYQHSYLIAVSMRSHTCTLKRKLGLDMIAALSMALM